jgi:multicomponent Na+:H+ antiporter subunit G
MNGASGVLVAAGVAMAWLGAISFIRLHTPFERLHAVTFVNVTALGFVVEAAFVHDGISSRSLKCALIYLVVLAAGALLTHVTGRALHFREGQRR